MKTKLLALLVLSFFVSVGHAQLSERCGRILHDPETVAAVNKKYLHPMSISQGEVKQWTQYADDLKLSFTLISPVDKRPFGSECLGGACWTVWVNNTQLYVEKTTELPPIFYTPTERNSCIKVQEKIEK